MLLLCSGFATHPVVTSLAAAMPRKGSLKSLSAAVKSTKKGFLCLTHTSRLTTVRTTDSSTSMGYPKRAYNSNVQIFGPREFAVSSVDLLDSTRLLLFVLVRLCGCFVYCQSNLQQAVTPQAVTPQAVCAETCICFLLLLFLLARVDEFS